MPRQGNDRDTSSTTNCVTRNERGSEVSSLGERQAINFI